MFSSDMSWVEDYREMLILLRGRGCQIDVLFEASNEAHVKENARKLEALGVRLLPQSRDVGLRATLIDPDDAGLASLFVAQKRRRARSLEDLEEGTPGDDKTFEYECKVYSRATDDVLIRAVSRLYEALAEAAA